MPINMCAWIGKVLLGGKLSMHIIYLVGKMFKNELYKTFELAQQSVEISGLKVKQQQ